MKERICWLSEGDLFSFQKGNCIYKLIKVYKDYSTDYINVISGKYITASAKTSLRKVTVLNATDERIIEYNNQLKLL